MRFQRVTDTIKNLLLVVKNFKKLVQINRAFKFYIRSVDFSDSYDDKNLKGFKGVNGTKNPLELFFDANKTGQGIWKWRHYFDVYHQHFRKFVGREVLVVEVGVYSGGSLTMWRNYFGEGCKIYGIDIQEDCKKYESNDIKIFIGDQADPKFWDDFRNNVSQIDIFVDDGSHYPQDQVVTLEKILPMLKPGGVYLCEDIHGLENPFLSYLFGLQKKLFEAKFIQGNAPLTTSANCIQHSIKSISIYPYVIVIEKNDSERVSFEAPKMGTLWEPFSMNVK